jgi:hypothetical protein
MGAGALVICSFVRVASLPIDVFMNKPMGFHIHAVKSRSESIARLGAFPTAGDVLRLGRKRVGQLCGDYYRNNREDREDSDPKVASHDFS